MIPLRLSLSNFLCYGEEVPPLSLEGIHIACLSGENGSGKSALLDAITWALWGRARGELDELVHYGKGEMAVELEFKAAAQRYRIVRRHFKARVHRQASTQCLLQVMQNGSQRIIAEGVRPVAEKLGQILHMDYDTFINSAFLRQGRADEFTRQKPTEKRKILGEILGLAFYSRLEERARGLAREREQQAQRLGGELQLIRQELAQRPSYEAELAETEAQLQALGTLLREQEQQRERQRQAVAELVHKQNRTVQLDKEVAAQQEECRYWQQREQQHRDQIQDYEAVIGRREQIEAGYQALQQAQREDEELGGKLLALRGLEGHQAELKGEVENTRRDLERERKTLSEAVAGLSQKGQRLPAWRETLSQTLTQLEKLKEQEARLEAERREVLDLSAALARCRAEADRLKLELADIAEKRRLLSGEEARCPLCQTKLGEAELRRLRADYQEREREQSRQSRDCLQEAEQKQRDLSLRQQRQSQEDRELKRESGQLQGRREVLYQEIAAAEQALTDLAGQRERLEATELRLSNGDFAQSQKEALAQVAAEIARLNYDQERHRQVKQGVKELKGWEQEQHQLRQAEQRLPTVREDRQQAEAALSRGRQRQEALRQETAALNAEVARLPELKQELLSLERDCQRRHEERDGAQRRKGALSAQLSRLQEREREREEKEKLWQQAERERGIYTRLAEALGKNGVQALIVEQALRELEEEADGLLKRLTDGRMSLRFETQRTTQAGEIVEALELKIDDEGGPRSYEMFSGGEAFRINFALRVALSQLLARRAGAPLRLLVVDEGFGTQDQGGREKLMDAIRTIAGDFDQILVITHLEDLKEQFPVRIEVSKTPAGSTWTLSM